MPGPPRKPTHLKLIEGNPGKKALPKNEPQPERGIPDVPAHLSDDAKVEWERVSNQLDNLGLLTMIDRAALAAYCQSWSNWIEAEEQLRKYGKLIQSPVKTIVRRKQNGGDEETETVGGYPRPSPFLSIRNNALEMMHKFLIEFGMTPAARSRVAVVPRATVSKFAGLIGGTRPG